MRFYLRQRHPELSLDLAGFLAPKHEPYAVVSNVGAQRIDVGYIECRKIVWS